MFSAVVFMPFAGRGIPLERPAEHVVRSLASLVSASVAGLVRDVVIAGPTGLDLQIVADHAGCTLAEAATPGTALEAGLRSVRQADVLLLRAGYAIGAEVVEELGDRVGGVGASSLRLRATGDGFVQRLFPALAPVVGLLAPTDLCRRRMPCDLHELLSRFRGTPTFRTRARRAL